jgi:small GTP-binding protein
LRFKNSSFESIVNILLRLLRVYQFAIITGHIPSSLNNMLNITNFIKTEVRKSRQSIRYFSNIYETVAANELTNIDINHIRNFSVIAHVDHGKSTLSDAILVMTGNISEKDRKKGQVLDTLKVERDRGITVKAQTASMIFEDKRTNERYLINLIDTPGHIDFSYEVARSLASCQGALLLVDSTQSVQAQTLANHAKAKVLGLEIIPVVTKIDLPSSQPEETALTMGSTFSVDPDAVIWTSAKKNIGVLEVLEAVVDKLPSPALALKDVDGPFLGRIVDSWFDEHRGVVCLIQAIGGTLRYTHSSPSPVKIVNSWCIYTYIIIYMYVRMYINVFIHTYTYRENERITTFASSGESKDIDGKSDFSVQEIGILTPAPLRTNMLRTGQVGYVIAGMRSTRQARIGDTMFVPAAWTNNKEVEPLPGYEAAKPMLFASVFPVDTMDLDLLFASVDRLMIYLYKYT